jgi:hypothetical protein
MANDAKKPRPTAGPTTDAAGGRVTPPSDDASPLRSSSTTRGASAVALIAIAVAAFISSQSGGQIAPPAPAKAPHKGKLMTYALSLSRPNVSTLPGIEGENAPRVVVRVALRDVNEHAPTVLVRTTGVVHDLLDARAFVRGWAKISDRVREAVPPMANGRPALYARSAFAGRFASLLSASPMPRSLDEYLADSRNPNGVTTMRMLANDAPTAAMLSLPGAGPSAAPIAAVADVLDVTVERAAGGVDGGDSDSDDDVAVLTLQVVAAPGPMVSELKPHGRQVPEPNHPQRHFQCVVWGFCLFCFLSSLFCLFCFVLFCCFRSWLCVHRVCALHVDPCARLPLLFLCVCSLTQPQTHHKQTTPQL